MEIPEGDPAFSIDACWLEKCKSNIFAKFEEVFGF